MKHIENRVRKLENHFNATGKHETLEDQMKSFDEGRYDKLTMMSVVAAYLERGKEALEGLPLKLAGWFSKNLEKKKRESSTQVENDKMALDGA